MATVLRLESFDAGRSVRQSVAQISDVPQGYHEGYAAGVAAAEATMLVANDQLQSDLVQIAKSALSTHETSQQQVVAAVAPLLDTLISTLLPKALLPVLHARLRDLVLRALEDDAAMPLILKVPPGQVDAVTKALADLAHAPLTILADPTLSNAAAWAIAPNGETALDLDGALAEIAGQIAAIQTLSTQTAEAS